MTNFIFKSTNGLIKNLTETSDNLMKRVNLVLAEQRFQRSDLKDIKLMINRLLVDKHLTDQANEYFEDSPQNDLEDK